MLLTFFLNAFEMVPVAPIITGITFVFTFHTSYYYYYYFIIIIIIIIIIIVIVIIIIIIIIIIITYVVKGVNRPSWKDCGACYLVIFAPHIIHETFTLYSY